MNDSDHNSAQQQRPSSSLLDRLTRLSERAESIRKRLGEDVSWFAGAEPEMKENFNKLGAPTPVNGMMREANSRVATIEDTLTRIETLLKRLHEL